MYFLNEIWLYGMSDQIYLITLLMVFSLVAYLYIKNRKAQQFDIPVREQFHFLRTISESSEHGEMFLDSHNCVQFVNSEFRKLFSVDTEDLLGSDIVELAIFEGIEKAVSTDENSRNTFSIKDGDLMSVISTPVNDDEGKRLGTFLRVERLPKPEAESADKELSHELKTPLNAILGLSEVLKSDDKVPKSYQKLFSDIVNQSSLLNDRINRWILGQDKSGTVGSDSTPEVIEGNTILIVDDVTINRTLLRMMLERKGFKTVEAKNGKEAIEQLKSVRPAMVLMDLSMPVMDGLESVSLIRKLDDSLATIPVVAVTASHKHSEKSLIDHGFTGLVRKPFKESDLFRYVGEPEVA